jgi:hypothetical protein
MNVERTGWLCASMLVAATTSAPGPTTEIAVSDPRLDDHGPGGYIYPTDFWYRRGTFDLRSVVVQSARDRIIFRIRFDFPVEAPEQMLARTDQAITFDNEIYLQNVDIFIDHTPNAGEVEGIPGRNVRFRRSEAWDFALVLTPQPDLVRQILRGWPPARKLLVADTVRSRGPEVWVEVDATRVGAWPSEDWGIQVVVSGVLFRNNFEVFQRVTDAFRIDALTMPVFGVAETQAFGGGDLSRWQPRAIDILTPKGVTQAEVLSHYDHETRDFALLPMVYPNGRRPVATATSTAPGTQPSDAETGTRQGPADLEVETTVGPDDGFVHTRVREVHGTMVILESRPSGIEPYRIGTVMGEGGEELGRVVVTAIYPEFVQATIVQGQERVKRGARVRFDPPKEQNQ